jgi:hypothetical protein
MIRYQYLPYGAMAVLDANFAADSDGMSDMANSTWSEIRA